MGPLLGFLHAVSDVCIIVAVVIGGPIWVWRAWCELTRRRDDRIRRQTTDRPAAHRG